MKYKKYLRNISESCTQVFNEMANLRVKSYEITSINVTQNLQDYAVAIAVPYKNESEELKGSFFLGFADKEKATRLASSIAKNMGLPPEEEFSETTSDILFEFMNTVVGQAITKWDALGFSVEFGAPYATDGATLGENANLRREIYSIVIKFAGDSLAITVSFDEVIKSPLQGRKILAVDDSKMIRSLLVNLFEKEGCQVSQAQNGIEAVQQFSSFKPDLTIMDLVMPKMGGLEAIAHIRELDSSTKIVVLTSSSKKSEVMAASKLKVKGYIKKPLKTDRLLELAINCLKE